jgi:hypothetical protein
VILLTVPHVTIAPVARGVRRQGGAGSRYFHDYTRPWVADRDFDRRNDPYLASDEARAIDSVIDQYNDASPATSGARASKAATGGCSTSPAARPPGHAPLPGRSRRPPADWWTPYAAPDELLALSPPPDTRFMASGPSGRTAGGLFLPRTASTRRRSPMGSWRRS